VTTTSPTTSADRHRDDDEQALGDHPARHPMADRRPPILIC